MQKCKYKYGLKQVRQQKLHTEILSGCNRSIHACQLNTMGCKYSRTIACDRCKQTSIQTDRLLNYCLENHFFLSVVTMDQLYLDTFCGYNNVNKQYYDILIVRVLTNVQLIHKDYHFSQQESSLSSKQHLLCTCPREVSAPRQFVVDTKAANGTGMQVTARLCMQGMQNLNARGHA